MQRIKIRCYNTYRAYGSARLEWALSICRGDVRALGTGMLEEVFKKK